MPAACLSTLPTNDQNKRIRLEFDLGLCFLEIYDFGIRLYSDQQRNFDYGLLEKSYEPVEFSLQGYETYTDVETEKFVISITHAPFSYSVSDRSGRVLSRSPTDGHFVRRHRVPPLSKTENGWFFASDLASGEPVYGLGEKWGALNKRGQLVRSYNSDALGVNAEISYKNTPFCWSPEGWGIFAHTPASVTHSVGHSSWSQRTYCCLIEDEFLDIFVLLHSPEQDVNVGAKMIESYTDMTGRAPLPPSWSGGVILSKAYYNNPEELLSVANELRERKLPCDTITIDGRAWQDTNTRFAFEWDKSRWPDPKAVLDELKELGFKICIWEYPLISVKHEWFKLFADKGWLLKDKRTGEAYKYDWDQQAFDEVLSPLPKSGLVDFTHPDAYAFWRDAHKDLFDIGVDMIKADFGEQVEDDNMIAYNGESGNALHNVYSHLYNRCVFEAAEKYSKFGPFLFSRSSWIGCQRFNSHWGGDPQADWEGMMGNIRGGLSWGLSGSPFYATDIGGFYKDTRDDELYVRWAQAAVFSAHYRMHGIGAREPWSYSDEAHDAVLKALDLRYRLQTYLQETMHQATQTGLPVQRAMVLSFPNEKASWAFENQFMFGNDILVAPCFKPGGRVEVYLPKGPWVLLDVSTSNHCSIEGGRTYCAELALDEMAVFVRVGVSIPLNDSVETTHEIEKDEHGLFLPGSSWLA